MACDGQRLKTPKLEATHLIIWIMVHLVITCYNMVQNGIDVIMKCCKATLLTTWHHLMGHAKHHGGWSSPTSSKSPEATWARPWMASEMSWPSLIIGIIIGIQFCGQWLRARTLLIAHRSRKRSGLLGLKKGTQASSKSPNGSDRLRPQEAQRFYDLEWVIITRVIQSCVYTMYSLIRSARI